MGRSWLRSCAAAPLLVLSGCGGGGGVSSTPAPAPSPTPSPTSTPTPTPSPTATPSPTPTPSPVLNLSFDASPTRPLVKSQTFTASNQALMLVKRDPAKAPAFPASILASSLSVGYDAAQDSYTLVTEQGGSAPAQISRTMKLDQLTANADGSKSLLKLTPGAKATSYVRIGEWTDTRTDDVRSSFFTIGMMPAAVRSGTASYAIAARGRIGAAADEPILDFSGTGQAVLNFATLEMRGSVPLAFADWSSGAAQPAASMNGNLLLSARIISSALGFTGSAHLGGSVGQYSGNFSGAMFGPQSEEIGGTFLLTPLHSAANFLEYKAAVGAIAGALDTAPGDPNDVIGKLADLPGMTALGYVYDPVQMHPRGIGGVAYNPATRAYDITFKAMSREIGSSNGVPITRDSLGGTASFSAATRDAVQTMAGFDAHTAQIAPGQKVHGFILRPDNPDVTLSYVSFAGLVAETKQNGAGGVLPAETWFRSFAYFGNSSGSIPPSGTGSYSGAVLGFGTLVQPTGPAMQMIDAYNVTGKARMTVDFGARTFSATLSDLAGVRAFTTAQNDPSKPTYLFDPVSYSGVMILVNDFYSNVSPANPYDSFRGMFMGPNAAEFGALFESRRGAEGVDPIATRLTGVVAGSLDPPPP